MAIITSGSSITLAAGGVTPQFTLASTGAVTLTGALNGTSASFTGGFELNNTGTGALGFFGANNTTDKYIRIRNSSGNFEMGTSSSEHYLLGNGGIPLKFYTSGSPRLEIASTGAATFSGDVGVVKSSPLYYLQNSTSITTGTRGDLAWYNSSVSTVALIRASAITDNVGTSLEFHTRPAAGSLTQVFTLASTGAATFSSSVTANGVMSLGNDGTYGSGYKTLGLTGNTNGTHRIFAGTSDDFHIAAATGRGIIFWTDGVTGAKMSILPSGNVGIGTASPGNYLLALDRNVAGYSVMSIKNSESAGYSAIHFLNNSGTLIGHVGYANSGVSGALSDQVFFGSIASKNVVFTTADTERMRITSLGYLKASNTGSYQGISERYHELRTNLGDEWTAIIGNSSSSPYGIQLRYAGASPNGTANQFLVCSDSSTDRLRISSNGNVTNTNGSYGAISDAKLKENIEDATPKLDDLMKVNVRNYNLIGDDKKQIGVIAQELEEVFPAMIDESEDFEEVEVPQVDEEGNEILNEEGEVVTEKQRVSKGTTTKSVKYSVFVPMLIKAMQEQQEQIKSLTEQVEALKSQING